MAFDLPDEITIAPEFRDLIPPLTDEEFKRLEDKLLSEGCTEPLKLWAHGDQDILIDGHHRYRICQEHGIDMPEPVYIRGLDTRDDVIVWMIENQLGRRNISDFARNELALKEKAIIEKRAKERSLANLKHANSSSGSIDPLEKQDILPKNEATTAETLAEIAGTSASSIKRTEKILKEGAPEVIEKARSGEMSINAAYQTVKQQKHEPEPPKEEPGMPVLDASDSTDSDSVQPDGTDEDLKSKSEQELIDECCSTDFEKLCTEQSEVIDHLTKKLEVATASDAVAENLKLQDIIFGHEQRINTLGIELYEKDRQLKWHLGIFKQLQKLLGVEKYGEIVGAVRKLKGM